MLKGLIILEGNEKYQCNTVKDIAEKLIDNNYYELPAEERKNKIKMLAIANCMNNGIEILEDIKENQETNLDGKFIIKDEITYILSLLMMNKIVLLERVDANEFLKDIDKSKISDNYIIVNKYAKVILIEYLNKKV
ncbi:MAG: hypothetical protein IJ223_05445 [Clostridia bacterium]|nr:hypothetical protein [Clostridia bacterium]